MQRNAERRLLALPCVTSTGNEGPPIIFVEIDRDRRIDPERWADTIAREIQPGSIVIVLQHVQRSELLDALGRRGVAVRPGALSLDETRALLTGGGT